MKRRIAQSTQDRLEATECGRALLELLDIYGGYPEIARAAQTDNQTVRVWFYKGKISSRGACRFDELGIMSREKSRPDIDSDGWSREFRGPIPGHKPVLESDDAKLLVELSKQFGSVRNLCRAGGFLISDFHTWKSRGRIPAIKLPMLLSMCEPGPIQDYSVNAHG